MKCPKCETINPADSKFCSNCAAPLPGTSARPSSTETFQAPVLELTTGSTFAGRYQIIEELGHGGMGKVYKVFDTDIKEKIALKLLRPEIALDKETVERFSNELKLARKISHRNVCRMFDLGKAEGTTFITMEFVPGEDLKKFIRKSGQVGAGRAVSIAKQVCEGLAEAHHLGVVHRDLKPQNIMVDEDGNARIMDFGIARSLRGKGITGAGVMIGTPEYMSPEQVEGKEADQRSDIYSLGIILYEMLTGRVPFEGDTPFTIGVKQKSEAPRDPRQLNAQIPEDLSHLILRCLEKDKDKRYQSTDELHAELTRFEEEIPTAERAIPKKKPTKSREIAVKAGKSKWAKIGLYAGSVVIVAVMVFLGLRLFTARGEAIDSIAVLPFENVNADPNTDYLCDGIAETIINKLSELSSFKTVICRNSAFRYKGKAVDPRTVGEELGVKAVLLTRLIRAGDQLTISPTLVRTKDNSQIWGERYQRKLEDVLSIEESIASSIVQALQLKLTRQDEKRIAGRPIDNASAYECFLRANHQIWSFSKEALDGAVQDLQKGLEIIGPNALLYSALANAYRQYVNIGAEQEDYLVKAEDSARRALALDPNSSKAYAILGYISEYKSQREGISYHKKALDVNPNEIEALRRLALIYAYDIGKVSLALPLVERLKRVDPLNADVHMLQGYVDYTEGRFKPALDEFRQYYQSDPQSANMQSFYAQSLAYNNRLEEAFAIVDRMSSSEPDNVLTKFGLLTEYGLRKDKEKALRIMTPDFRKTCRRDLEWSLIIAEAFALMDEKQEALDWLENAVNLGLVNSPFLNTFDPFLANIRGEERFQKLMERVKYEWEHFEE